MSMSKNIESDIAYVHIRPGVDPDKKEQPVGTVAVWLLADDVLASPRRHSVGYSTPHSRLDKWDAAMGRAVAGGRATRSAKRLSVFAAEHSSRRDLLASAVARVLEAAEAGEISASRRFIRALGDTLERMTASKQLSEARKLLGEDAIAPAPAFSAAE